jgi:hypothetical protein
MELLNLGTFLIATLSLVLVPFLPLWWSLRKQTALEWEN